MPQSVYWLFKNRSTGPPGPVRIATRRSFHDAVYRAGVGRRPDEAVAQVPPVRDLYVRKRMSSRSS